MSGIIPQLIRNVFVRQPPATIGSKLKDRSPYKILLSTNRIGHLGTSPSNGIHISKPFEGVRDYKPGAGRRIIIGRTKGVTAAKLRGDIYDESDESKENTTALESASLAEEASEYQLETHRDIHNLFPDETTADILFNGVKYVVFKCYDLVISKVNYLFRV